MRYTSMTLTGASGSLDTTEPVPGTIRYIRVSYTNGAAEGTLALTDKQTGMALLSLADNVAVAGPLGQLMIDTNGAEIAGVVGMIPVTGYITAAWAAHNSNTTILVELWI